MGSPPAVIEARDLRKTYGGVAVLPALNLTVQAGEVFALLGPNGAGKTTSVEILSGFRRRTSGDVQVLGEDPGDFKASWRSRIGVVPQSTGTFNELKVREVVRHFASFYPSSTPADEVIDKVGLTEKSGALARTLSGGQRRKLDIALGIVGRPELLFLDEPTTGLDPDARRMMWQVVRDLAAEGTTIVLTTHYLDEAEQLSDRAGILIRGKLVALGPPQEIGGRAGDEASVSFLLPSPTAELPALADEVSATFHDVEGGRRVVLTSPAPTQLLGSLAAWAARSGTPELADLTVTRPSLEDTYLRLLHERDNDTNNDDTNNDHTNSDDTNEGSQR